MSSQSGNVTACSFNHNSGDNGGAVLLEQQPGASPFRINGWTFDHNSANNDGGSLAVFSLDTVFIANSNFTNSSSYSWGGAIAVMTTPKVLFRNVLVSNTLRGTAGVTFWSCNCVGILDSTFTNSTQPGVGFLDHAGSDACEGAMYLETTCSIAAT